MVGVSSRNSSHVGPKRPRGRGLRSKTGCITCRKRHMKCDEQKPCCENCTRAGKPCSYHHDREDSSTSFGPPLVAETDVEPGPCPDELNTPIRSQQACTPLSNGHVDLGPNTLDVQHVNHFTSPGSTGTASLDQPIGVATARWFDMLAKDAAIEVEPTLVSHTTPTYAPNITANFSSQQQSNLQYNHVSHTSVDAPSLANIVTASVSQVLPVLSDDEMPWKSSIEFTLQDEEAVMFSRFVIHISQWIDFLDPYKHFATLVPRLALRNTGLLNAILALSIRHSSLDLSEDGRDMLQADRTALSYYHQTLHYVSTAMQYTTYHTSLELLATTLIISAFEMLHGSSQDWKRHLQGVFWIQRSQVIHGDSGGLRGAVWWAWLCQDIWAAFRDKRRVFTFWKPETPFKQLDPTRLAIRSIFLLSKVINYCVKEDDSTDIVTTISSRLKAAESLSHMLDEWESLLTPEFMPLPYNKSTAHSDRCKSIWIHPPLFACSVQIFHAARLLVLLHKPSLGGFEETSKKQTKLNTHIETICGIALTLSDYASSTICSICLFIGLSTIEQQQRQLIVFLLEENRKRTGWPVKSLGEELVSLWQNPSAT